MAHYPDSKNIFCLGSKGKLKQGDGFINLLNVYSKFQDGYTSGNIYQVPHP